MRHFCYWFTRLQFVSIFNLDQKQLSLHVYFLFVAVNVLLSLDETYGDIMPVRLDSDSPTAFVLVMFLMCSGISHTP